MRRNLTLTAGQLTDDTRFGSAGIRGGEVISLCNATLEYKIDL